MMPPARSHPKLHGQIVENRNKSKYTQPAHSNVDHRGKPFWAVDPAALEDHSDDGNGPYEGTEDIPVRPWRTIRHTGV